MSMGSLPPTTTPFPATAAVPHGTGMVWGGWGGAMFCLQTGGRLCSASVCAHACAHLGAYVCVCTRVHTRGSCLSPPAPLRRHPSGTHRVPTPQHPLLHPARSRIKSIVRALRRAPLLGGWVGGTSSLGGAGVDGRLEVAATCVPPPPCRSPAGCRRGLGRYLAFLGPGCLIMGIWRWRWWWWWQAAGPLSAAGALGGAGGRHHGLARLGLRVPRRARWRLRPGARRAPLRG